eukprot:403364335
MSSSISAAIMAGNQNKKIAESKSLWNYALSPGWTQQEVEILKIALMKFGVGRWSAINKSGVLPTKQIQQCYLQTQRLIGQQSLAEFMGLHLDIDRIAADNKQKRGIRKQGFLVNQGCKLTPEEKDELRKINQEKYGLSAEHVEAIKLPAPCHLVEIFQIDKIMHPRSTLSTMDKIKHLIKLEDALKSKLEMIREGKRQQKFEQLQQKLKTTEASGRGSVTRVQRQMSDLHLGSSHQNRNSDLDEENDESVMIIDESQQENLTPKGKAQAMLTHQKYNEVTQTMIKQGDDSRQQQHLPLDSTSASVSNPSSTSKSSTMKSNSMKQSETAIASMKPSSIGKKTKVDSSFVTKQSNQQSTAPIQKQAHQQNLDRNRSELGSTFAQQASVDTQNSNNQGTSTASGNFISQSDDEEALMPKLKRRRVEDSE